MTLELDIEHGTTAEDAVRESRPRPNVAGDLPTVLRAGPMFGRAVAGYDRFEVDTYVQWAEEELATAEREIEHLVDRQLSTQAALDEARQLLGHSADGGELLQVSRRIGALLAAAADEAADIRAEARAERAAGVAEVQQRLARADETIAAAREGARRLVADAMAAATGVSAEAARALTAAEAALAQARAEATDLRDRARRELQDAEAQADRVRRAAERDAAAALLHARAEALALLHTGREQRRRADDRAAAARARLR